MSAAHDVDALSGVLDVAQEETVLPGGGLVVLFVGGLALLMHRRSVVAIREYERECQDGDSMRTAHSLWSSFSPAPESARDSSFAG